MLTFAPYKTLTTHRPSVTFHLHEAKCLDHIHTHIHTHTMFSHSDEQTYPKSTTNVESLSFLGFAYYLVGVLAMMMPVASPRLRLCVNESHELIVIWEHIGRIATTFTHTQDKWTPYLRFASFVAAAIAAVNVGLLVAED